MLDHLYERDVIIYDKQKEKPQLTFLTPRIHADNLPLNVYELEQTKQRALGKVRAALHYAEHAIQCRTRLIQTYFGEETDQACGICDNCLKQKKTLESASLAVREQVRQYVAIANGPGISPRQLADYFKTAEAETLAQTVRQMLAEEELKYTKSGNLTLNA